MYGEAYVVRTAWLILVCINVARGQGKAFEIKLACNIYNESQSFGDGIGVVFLNGRVVLDCRLIDSNQTQVTFPEEDFQPLDDGNPPLLNLTIFNSSDTYQHSHKPDENGTRWVFPLISEDFFRPYSDFELPPEPSELQINQVMKWIIRLVAYHPMMGRLVHHRLVVIPHKGDPLLQNRWGLPISQPPSQAVFGAMLESPQTTVFTVETPCQSGCGLLVVSSLTSTYISSSCDLHLGSTTSWYKWTCPFADLLLCPNSRLIDGVYAGDHVLFVTSQGVIVSDALRLKSMSDDGALLQYTLMNESFANFSVDWNSAKFSFSPLCAVMDYVFSHGDVVLLTVSSTSGEKLVFGAAESFVSWTLFPKLTTNQSDDVTVTYDRQTGSLISIHTNSSNTYSQVHLRTDLEASPFATARYPRHVIGGRSDRPIKTLLLSNHHYYVAVGSGLWVSTDGGNFYSKIFDMNAGESAVSIVGLEITKVFAVVTSQGRLLLGKAGFDKLQVILTTVDVARAIVSFDHVGNILLINNEASSQLPSVSLIPVPDLTGVSCRFQMWTEGALQAVNFVQFKQNFEFKVFVRQTYVIKSLDKPWFSVNFGNPRPFRTSTHLYRLNPYTQMVKIDIISKFLVQGVTTVSVNLHEIEDYCPDTSVNVIVVAGCHASKHLHFNYSTFLIPGTGPALTVGEYTSPFANMTRNLLFELPANYRAPSSLAVAIPLSSNLYNVHPTTVNQTRFLSYGFAEEKKMKSFCKDATERSQCACTSALKFSSLEKHSDCKEKVYKVLYNTLYNIKLSITMNYGVLVDDVTPRGNGDDVTPSEDMTKFFVYLEEVNGRDESVYTLVDLSTDFCDNFPDNLICRARGQDTTNEEITPLLRHLTSGRSRYMYNASHLSIKLVGSGLFHFRITVANGFSFCPLQDEFQAYVANPPLPFPTGTIIRLTVSAVMGVVLILIYARFQSHNFAQEEAEEPNLNPRPTIRPIPRNTSVVSDAHIQIVHSRLKSNLEMQ